MANIAEINEKNEKTIDAIIGEMTSDNTELPTENCMVEDFENDEINIDDKRGDFEFSIMLSCGDIYVIEFSNNDLDDIIKDLDKFDEMIEHFRNHVTALYEHTVSTEEYDVTKMEDALAPLIQELNIPCAYDSEICNDDNIRILMKLNDLINIYTVISHAAKEKRLADNLITTFAIGAATVKETNQEEEK